MRKIISIVLVLSFCISFCHAWNSESFIGLDQVQTLDAFDDASYSVRSDTSVMMMQSPALMSVGSDAVAVAADDGLSSISGIDFLANFTPLVSTVSPLIFVYHAEETIGGGLVTVPAWTEFRAYPEGGAALVKEVTSTVVRYIAGAYTIPAELNGGEPQTFRGLCFDPSSMDDEPEMGLSLSFDLSSFGSFTSFELSGGFYAMCRMTVSSGGFVISHRFYAVDLYVNDTLVKTFYSRGRLPSESDGWIDFSHYIFNSSSPITSMRFVLRQDDLESLDPGHYAGDTVSYRPYITTWYDSKVPCAFTVLEGDTVLDGFNSEGQDAVNDLNSLEAEWTGQMTSNFNSLNVSDFTYPGGLIPAFALISGIFNDFWNLLGDFKIVYVFPLTLGVVLVVIGRLSKTAGSRSSSKSDGGDDGA